ncbi:MAG: substrate-binding domain-containing protein [Verrucomicrobiota bacterium]|nr:substrate-binding domain-containing protein [Verrucomicrobiota bacterium]
MPKPVSDFTIFSLLNSPAANRRRFLHLLGGAAMSASLPGVHGASRKSYRFGMIAKSQGNPFFEASRVGAEDAARELGAKHGVNIKIDWRTPNEEDAQKQAEFVEQLLLGGVDGILISCSDANKLTSAINKAVEQAVPVATFSGDAPASKRFVALGIDDFDCGVATMDALAKELGGKGVVAAIDGNPNAANLQKRAAGFREAGKKHKGIQLRDIYYHKETPQDAVAKIEQVMQANPDITGWGLLGGWPLFTQNALKWSPGTIKCVCVDALPQQLPYVRSGHVQLLLSQDVYGYGYHGVEHLLNKVMLKKNPAKVLDNTPLTPVNKDNLEEFAKNWEKWMPKKAS